MRRIHFALILLLLLSAGSASAFQDRGVHRRLNQLRASLASENSLQKRIQQVEGFKDDLNLHLRTMPLDQSRQGLAEFTSLNETLMAVLTIRVNARTKAVSCRQSSLQIQKEGRLPEEGNRLAPSAQIALELLKLVCR